MAIPDLSHLLVHEDDGPRLMHGFRVEHLTVGRRTPTAEDLGSLPAGLGAALIELPLRDAGCILPTWDGFVARSAAAAALGVPLHVDGARLWESQPFYDRPLSEIAALADSVYVSFYKGPGRYGGGRGRGGAGRDGRPAALAQEDGRHAPPDDAVCPLRTGRAARPAAADGGVRRVVAWSRAFAGELVRRGIRVNPDPPQTNTFEVFAQGDPDVLELRLVEFLERERVQPCQGWRPSEVPGMAKTR